MFWQFLFCNKLISKPYIYVIDNCGSRVITDRIQRYNTLNLSREMLILFKSHMTISCESKKKMMKQENVYLLEQMGNQTCHE